MARADNIVVKRSLTAARSLSLVLRAGRGLLQAIAPAACVFCGAAYSGQRRPICDGCYAELPWIRQACGRCAIPVAATLSDGVYCPSCQADPPPYAAAAAPLGYAFPVDSAIKALKFRRKLHYVPAFVHALEVALPRIPGCPDAIVPVPLHWRRQTMRGFNQALELGQLLHRRTGVPLFTNVVRRRATPFQSGLAAKYRRRNLRDAFVLRGAPAARHVLIVDDVITTGETCRAIAQVLLDVGIERVSVLAVARA